MEHVGGDGRRRAIAAGAVVLGLAFICGCGQSAAASSDAGPATVDAAMDAGAQVADGGIDAGPLGCTPGAGTGIELVSARFPRPAAFGVFLDGLCDSLVRVVCDAVEACACGASAVARCRDSLASTCAATIGSPSTRDVVASGAVAFDPAAAAGVVAMIGAGMASCEGVLPYDLALFFVAAGAFRGSLPEGSLCDHALACADGLECRNTGDFVFVCRPTGLEGCEALGLCQEGPVVAPRLACARSVCDHRLPPGAISGPGRYCRWATRADGVCGCEPGVGAPCAGPFECGSGYCASDVCAERTRRLGESCASPYECDAAACVDGVCAPFACLVTR